MCPESTLSWRGWGLEGWPGMRLAGKIGAWVGLQVVPCVLQRGVCVEAVFLRESQSGLKQEIT